MSGNLVINKIFSEFQKDMTAEQEIREVIRAICKDTDQLSREISTVLQDIHYNEEDIAPACLKAREMFNKAREGYQKLKDAVPARDYYKFNDHWRNMNQRYSFLIALVVWLEKGIMVQHETVAEILGKPNSLVLPVLLIACDRVTVKRCLDNLIKFRPSKETFPIIVSQDCGHNATYEVIKSFTDADPSITVVRQPDLSEIPLPRVKVKFRGYYKIARHYKFALNYVLKQMGHEAVIIVEDDLDISPDFFEYFLGTYPLLYKDPSLWCISAWNDNGKKEVIDLTRPELLHRTDFFPGLGWLLRADTWRKLEAKWPPAFFDDWLRNPENVYGKSCIRPEISRTYSFGKIGVSKGLFFDMHLRNIQLNMEFVEFTKLNLTYLLKENYDAALEATVDSLPVLTAEEVFTGTGTEPARVVYSNAHTYTRSAKKLGLMDDFRSGVPRTAYRGIVTCFVHGRRIYLAPDYRWEKYDPKWG